MHRISNQARRQLIVLCAAVLVVYAGVIVGAQRAGSSNAVVSPAPTHESQRDDPQQDRRMPARAGASKADVLTMLEQGFGESLIIEAIQVSGISFDVTVATMVELREAGATEQLLRALLAELARLPPSVSGPTATRQTDMVLIPAGEFTMGVAGGERDTSPPHRVYLDAFYIDRHEVTNAEYERFDPGHKEFRAIDCDDCPVSSVNWSDAAAFAEWAGKRLPTEAEWEKAARGPEGHLYGYGAEYQDRLAHMNAGVSAAVGIFPANGYGLSDMLGNVWEWTADYYAEDYYQSSPEQNPTGPVAGPGRVIRGGAHDSSTEVHLAVRTWKQQLYRFSSIGFRCARDAETAQQE